MAEAELYGTVGDELGLFPIYRVEQWDYQATTGEGGQLEPEVTLKALIDGPEGRMLIAHRMTARDIGSFHAELQKALRAAERTWEEQRESE